MLTIKVGTQTISPVYSRRRPKGGNNFPLVSLFLHTGEADNPWRCENCTTKKQHHDFLLTPNVSPEALAALPAPKCCRKCGMDFYR